MNIILCLTKVVLSAHKMGVIHNMWSSAGHHTVVLNYLGILIQRFSHLFFHSFFFQYMK